jgi:hypothetical protein
MITFSIKVITSVADTICHVGYQLVFSRFTLYNQEELRGLRYVFPREKWIMFDEW